MWVWTEGISPSERIQADAVSLAEFLPNFLDRVREALGIILGEKGGKRIKIGLAKDGSGVGAALTALQAKKALDSGRMGTSTASGQPGPTGQTGSG